MPAADLLVGSQEPTHALTVPFEKTYGPLAVELANMVGLELDPWQQDLLSDGLGVVQGVDAKGDPAERWAAMEVGVELSRQNGKSVVFEARVLAGLFLLREQLIVYSAHETETAKKAFERVQALIESNGEMMAEVRNEGRSKGFRRTNGQLSITLWTGQVVIFRTRTGGGGRGLSGDCVILDEAQDLNDDHVAALMPVLSARPNPQLWYGGSAGTKRSTVQGRLIRRAMADPPSPRLVMYRWAMRDDDDPHSPVTHARLNPAYGRRLHPDTVAAEHRAMPLDKFGHERLGIGDYPRDEGEDWVIPRLNWDAAEDAKSKMVGPVVFALEVAWNRQRASIGVGGRNAQGRKHRELIANEPGTLWAVEELARLTRNHDNLGVMVDPASPANSMVGPLRDAGITVHLMKAQDLTQAFGTMWDEYHELGTYRTDDGVRELPRAVHPGGTILTSSMAEATTRDLGGSTTWRRATTKDVSPTLAVCWAGHGVDSLAGEQEPPPSPVSADDDEDDRRSRPAYSGGYSGGSDDIWTMKF